VEVKPIKTEEFIADPDTVLHPPASALYFSHSRPYFPRFLPYLQFPTVSARSTASFGLDSSILLLMAFHGVLSANITESAHIYPLFPWQAPTAQLKHPEQKTIDRQAGLAVDGFLLGG